MSADPQLPSLSPKPTSVAKADFFGMLPAQIEAHIVAKLGWKRYRADQVRDWVYRRGVIDPDRMSDLPQNERRKLSEIFNFAPAQVQQGQLSEDGTRKLLMGWNVEKARGSSPNAETVMIPDGDRRTACVSSQVGCPVGCVFCASGINGVKGNLSAAQIVEQVWKLNEAMSADQSAAAVAGAAPVSPITPKAPSSPPPRRSNSNITNVVFMGMGEPLANYANVMAAIRILHDPKCFNIGARRMTVSTVGVPEKMRQLAHEELPLNLAISLHAPNEKLRKKLIPWANHFSLEQILDAARYYFDETGREVTLEYILLANVNDRPEHARELAKLCKTLRANVNLIRYNPVEGLPFGRPESEDVVLFQGILRNNGINAHVRKSRGRDIDAACGQLRRKQGEAPSASPPQVVQIGQG